MSVTLTLLLAVPLCNATAGVAPITFEDMVDSAQLVVIAKVDSMWERMDTRLLADSTLKAFPYTHVAAEIITVFYKDTSLLPNTNLLHLVYGGGLGLHINPSVSFEEGEVFLAAITPFVEFQSKDETVYRVVWRRWKYTIANDSIFLHYAGAGVEPPSLSLAEVISSLSSHFIKKEAE